MQKISATVITFNEAQYLGECIDSLWSVADEVIVLDSYSSDNTVAIAKKKGAIVKQAPFTGYIEQKNKALSFTNHNYVLSLDADERISKKLAASILAEKSDFKFSAYFMNRYNWYCGKFINHGLWYPNRKLRLFDKRKAKWGGANPHDKIIMSLESTAGFLKGDILHYAYDSVDEHRRRNDELSSIAASVLFNSGQHKHWSKIFLSPPWSFFSWILSKAWIFRRISGFRYRNPNSKPIFFKISKAQAVTKAAKERITSHFNHQNP